MENIKEVENPEYYNLPGRKECIAEQKEVFGMVPVFFFCLLNCYKYNYRAGSKEGQTKENDLSKAHVYMDFVYHILVKYTLVRWIVKVFFRRSYNFVLENNKMNKYEKSQESDQTV